jgi:nitroreductase
MLLELTPDELLATSRSVRRPLDLTRPVERAVLEGCLQLAQQAPMASYAQHWHFVVVTDRSGGPRWGSCGEASPGRTWSGGPPRPPPTSALPASTMSSATWPSTSTRCRSMSSRAWRAGPTGPRWGAGVAVGVDHPAAWSFLLAARARGGRRLDHLPPVPRPRGGRDPWIPFEAVMQAPLLPVVSEHVG